jgi:hypothetical protein
MNLLVNKNIIHYFNRYLYIKMLFDVYSVVYIYIIYRNNHRDIRKKIKFDRFLKFYVKKL